MKFEIDKQTLKAALKQPTRLAKLKTSFQILQNILLEAYDGSLSITGTDLNTVFRITVPANVKEEGKVCVDAAHLDKVVGSCAETISINTEITCESKGIVIKTDKTKHAMPMADLAEWPQSVFHDGEYENEIDAELLALTCRKVAYCVSRDESRPDFNGACLIVKGGKATMVSTDGHRLAKADVACKGADIDSIIIPHKALPSLCELTGSVSLHVDKSKLHVKTEDGVQMSISLVAGRFPDFTKVFPTKFATKVTVESKPLKDMLRAASLAMSEHGSVRLDATCDRLDLSSMNKKCRASATVECITEGEVASVGINPIYLQQAIDTIGAETVTIGINDADSPILIEGTEDTDKHIVMPMQY